MKTTGKVLLVFLLFATYDASNQRASGIEGESECDVIMVMLNIALFRMDLGVGF